MQGTTVPSSGKVPVTAVLSREVDNIALLYGDSNDETWNALAFQVNQINRRIDYIRNLPVLEPGGTLDFGYFGESGHSDDVTSPGADQLRIAANVEETLYEFGVAIEPDGVLVGAQNPADEDITGIQDADRVRGYSPTLSSDNADFEDFGAIESQHTRTEDGIPTTMLSPTPRQGLVRFEKATDDRNNVYFGFRNNREDDAAITATAWGATYRVAVFQSEQTVRDVVFGNGVNRRVLTYGGLSNTSPKRADSWKQGEITLTSDDVRSLVGGGA